MWKIALNNGLIAGLVGIAITLIGTTTGLNDPFNTTGFTAMGALFTILSLAAMIFFIVRAMKQYREEENQGVLSYGQALGVGILTALVAGVVSAIYTFIHVSMIDPGVLDAVIEQTENQLEDQGMSEEEIDTAMQFTKIFTSAPFFALSGLFGSVFIGLVISLVAGAIVKRDAV